MAEASLSEPYIGKREVARRLGKTVRTVDNWMRRGMLPYYKCSRTVAFRWSEVQEFMREQFGVCQHSWQRAEANGGGQ
jgi:excisionase family DNA binding protein